MVRFQPSAFRDTRGTVPDPIRQLIRKALEFPVRHCKPHVKGVCTSLLLFASRKGGATVCIVYPCRVWRAC